MTLKPLDLKNEIAVVTGGANGIGKGIVKALLEEEMKVVKDYMDHWFHGGGKLKAKEWKKQLIAEKD